jgi:transcriptional regulator GlxA family with amidase domain
MQQKNTGVIQIASALDYINKNYAQPMKAKDLADVCSMSETHFRRVFEEYVNMSPMDYVNLVRIQRACDLMKKSNDSMETVAAKCGFSTTSTFNRNFKKFLDTSPYQWKIDPTNYERKLLSYNISALKGW